LVRYTPHASEAGGRAGLDPRQQEAIMALWEEVPLARAIVQSLGRDLGMKMRATAGMDLTTLLRMARQHAEVVVGEMARRRITGGAGKSTQQLAGVQVAKGSCKAKGGAALMAKVEGLQKVRELQDLDSERFVMRTQMMQK